MREAIAVILALIAFVFAGTCLWEIINPIFNIAHHGPIHVGSYAVSVLITALFACVAFWWSRKLFRDSRAVRNVG
jgi:predicted Co/Zn/Cd cation transporter (cation efflux family)